MTLSTRHRRAFVALFVVTAALPLAQTAQATPSSQISGAIAVPAGHKAYLTAHAIGVQIYTCNGTAWGPSTPDADLYDEKWRHIGTHFGGPTWAAKDGSSVRGQREAGVTVDESAIQWLRLKAVTPTAGPDGDRFKPTTYIQRIATTGGLTPPAGDCTSATAGTQRQVPYTADYVFWKATGV
jgi:hypothetical protein